MTRCSAENWDGKDFEENECHSRTFKVFGRDIKPASGGIKLQKPR
ncbi:unnamed protein product, partial [Linum tenue]